MGTFGLVIWTVYLGWDLPRVYVAAHWKLAWVGLDTAQVIVLLATTWAAYKRRLVIIFFATAAATMFIIDAWFDVTTARSGALHDSVLVALCVEIPAAIVLLWVSWIATRRATDSWLRALYGEDAPSAWHIEIPHRDE